MKSGKVTAFTGLFILTLFGAISRATADTTDTQTQSVSSTLTDWNAGLVFDQFDSSLGTLTGVYIEMSGSASTSIFLNNTSGESSSGTVSTRVRWRLSDPSQTIGTTTATKINMYLPDEDGAAYSLAGGASTTLGSFAASDSWSQTFTSSPVFMAFTGAGTITLTMSTLTGTVQENSGGNTTAVQTTTANGSVSLYYTYDAVPEPTTALLFAIGGAIVVLGRRKRA